MLVLDTGRVLVPIPSTFIYIYIYTVFCNIFKNILKSFMHNLDCFQENARVFPPPLTILPLTFRNPTMHATSCENVGPRHRAKAGPRGHARFRHKQGVLWKISGLQKGMGIKVTSCESERHKLNSLRTLLSTLLFFTSCIGSTQLHFALSSVSGKSQQCFCGKRCRAVSIRCFPGQKVYSPVRRQLRTD